ncbi:response regulator [Xanthomonas campestris]|uniref:Two-component system regulatory protein, probable n=1 Tax=Xanthomonas campestris pv. campestris (strain B100) TaxID=509169 RepID=B0RQ02_XANCB|nr:response regulator [Xanthomonas campestris]AKS19486.1 chemotaxis protein CheY [Xanthomonas campestris pv. campestris]ALE69609.1 chemotaxis protein CheY [Xanthomonas campestris pv. campestris]MCC3253501.1 response regulator [Xanthomonas campestris pv. armoraciae]MCC5046975.1 response regulator [Xanthomonas campestris]MCC5056455.1 response regulator [Xanthomonas campestris]
MSARVLVVEDESLVAMLLEDCLAELGYEVAGTVGDVSTALEAVKQGNLDMAVLDVNLGGTMSFPIAEELDARGVPYIFVTGYASSGIPEKFRHRHGVQKPFRFRDLQDALALLQKA